VLSSRLSRSQDDTPRDPLTQHRNSHQSRSDEDRVKIPWKPAMRYTHIAHLQQALAIYQRIGSPDARRGNRQLNYAIRMVAVSEIHYRHSAGRAYYERKLAEGKTGKRALRCPKRQISDAIHACLQAGAARAARERLPGQRGQLTPPAPAVRESHSQAYYQPAIPAAATADPAAAPLSRSAAITCERPAE
jgi:hypothetical protein